MPSLLVLLWGFAVITIIVVFFMAGIVTGILVYCCTSKYRFQGSKPEFSSTPAVAGRSKV